MQNRNTFHAKVDWMGSQLLLPQGTGPLVPFSEIGHHEDRVQPQVAQLHTRHCFQFDGAVVGGRDERACGFKEVRDVQLGEAAAPVYSCLQLYK